MTIQTPTTQERIATGTYGIDSVHSSAGFEVVHNTISTFRGGFREVTATLETNEEGATLTGAVKVESLDVEYPDLRAHLLSPEFFDAERHSEVRFRSSDLRIDGDDVVLAGELEINGEAQPVEAHGTLRGPVVGPDESERIALDFETVVDRRAFGFDWQMETAEGAKVLDDEVKLVVHLELVRS